VDACAPNATQAYQIVFNAAAISPDRFSAAKGGALS
jgi:hypothetical protein